MWLQKLLFLGTVVCSISAPISPPDPVTWTTQKHMAAIKEVLDILSQSNDTAVMNETVEVVSAVFDRENLTCLQTRLKLYQQGLRGSLTRIKNNLSQIARHYEQNCSFTSEASCETHKIIFKNFKEDLKSFLQEVPPDCKTKN